MIKAVIFDLDGTLADSEHIMDELYGGLFEEFGLSRPSEKEILKVIAHGGRRIILELLPQENKGDEELKRKMNARAAEISRSLIRKIRPMDGAAELLAELRKRGIKVVVATNRGSTTRELLDFLDFSRHMDVVVTAVDVKNPKPHPEPLLKALGQLGLKPEEALFVGDTNVDLQTGRAAGIKTMLLTKDNVSGQGVGSLREIISLLERGW